MSVQVAEVSVNPRRLGRSVAAVITGFLAVAVLSLVVDQLLHVLRVYPPWGEPMHDPSLNLLALIYRIVFTILGGYVTARLAPHHPMRHVLVLGLAGLVLSLLGAIATIPMNLGPAWYPIALVVTAVPCVWLGGKLHRMRVAT